MGKVISCIHAQAIRRRLRRQGKTVVFTNGVFDLLHIGHVRYLQAARRLGDALFVGLNSDQSAQDLKGPDRPLTPQDERAEVLTALACVDYVTIFPETTAGVIITALQPDIYVKGGDYGAGEQPGKPLPEAPTVASYGGRVVILPYWPSHSTSEVLRRIRSTKGEEKA